LDFGYELGCATAYTIKHGAEARGDIALASRHMLALSRTAGYAILALSCLEDAADRWVLVKDIVGKVDVPGPYLAKILHALAKAGVVRAKRGYRGGFMLARPAGQVSIAEIADAVEGESWLGGCMLGFTQCTEDRACPAHTLCKGERAKVRSFLESLTLRDVADFERRHGALPSLPVLGATARENSAESTVRTPRRSKRRSDGKAKGRTRR
jgi:Rrf2 family protein